MDEEKLKKKLIKDFQKYKNDKKYQIDMFKYILYKEGVKKYGKK